MFGRKKHEKGGTHLTQVEGEETQAQKPVTVSESQAPNYKGKVREQKYQDTYVKQEIDAPRTTSESTQDPNYLGTVRGGKTIDEVSQSDSEAPMPTTTSLSDAPNYEGTVRKSKYEVVEVKNADIDYLTSKSTTAPTYPIGDDEVDVYAVDTRIWDRMRDLLDGSGGDAGPHTHNNYADKTHDHPPQDLTHNHNGVYQPAGSYADKTHAHPDKADKTHTHDMSHTHNEYADADTLAQHLANHPSGGDGGSYDDSEVRALIAGNTDALEDKSDKTHTHNTSHTHPQYFPSGAETDEDGNAIPLPYADANTLGEAVDGKADEDHKHPYADENHLHAEYQAQIDKNEDRINVLEHELEAVAQTKEAGEWELVSILDFDIRGSGQMTLSTDDFTAPNNDMTLHSTDMNDVSHGFSGVEVGDLVEVVEENTTRSVGDYGLYEVVGINGQTFTLELQQGRGTADLNYKFFIKFFHLSDDVNIAELDARYALKQHTHPYVNTSKDSYFPHTTDYKWTNLKSQTPKNEDGNGDTSTDWGISIDLDEGNTYRHQFQVSTRHGYALKVLGGGGREVWIGGSLSQKSGDKTNPKPENYITRKNLGDALWIGSQAEYDAIANKSDDTLYVVM